MLKLSYSARVSLQWLANSVRNELSYIQCTHSPLLALNHDLFPLKKKEELFLPTVPLP